VILTIAAGFASTIFAPLMAWWIQLFGWRGAFYLIAILYLATCLPLALVSMERRWDLPVRHERDQTWHAIRSVVLTGRFARLMFATLAIAVGLYTATVNAVPLFEERGYTFEAAAWGLGIIGAGQVLGRLLFYVVPGRRIPWVQLVTAGGVSALLLFLLGAIAAPFIALAVIAFFAGAGRGAMTLVDATAVSDRWGTINYGAISGILHAPIAVLLGLTPALGVFLAGELGSFAAMTMVMAGIAALGAVVGRWT
jgi:predicted MFS family arabinose efflux permease